MHTLECLKTHVIACDLDDSLVMTDRHSERSRRASDDALLQIGTLITGLRAQHRVVHFGSATGRTLGSIQELANERPAFGAIFPRINFHIASVGTAIYARRADGNLFTRVPGWPNVDSWDRSALTDRLSSHPDLTPQEDAAQEDYKISYLTTNLAETAEHTAQLSAYLGAAGLQAEVIVSGGHKRRFVDILPTGVNKGSALLQLPQLIQSGPRDSGITAPETSICRIAVGDSMNDQAALAVADVAIIPGNGQPDLLEWAAGGQLAGSLFIADKPCAVGVLQGLQRHLFGS